MLLAALALSFGVQDTEGTIITAVIVSNMIIGFSQEYQAEKTMELLCQLSSPMAPVIWNGEILCVPAKIVVPEDAVVIKDGDMVPSNLLLISISNLEVSEQLLMGESVPGWSASTLSDCLNLCHSSTVITKGCGVGIAIGTGMNT
ncbi:hypothetical protein ARMGADRAFT_1147527 [Armillaria gallica]|uniref:P-type ATPase A domain-containing protein n=1 Tax=Armillaria gallica TaxID=47427 RepID=A0A2H3CX90_ARMGA|nr:hypothetical protein ARMGADRAFT_1147527 [Armillaria gallica]